MSSSTAERAKLVAVGPIDPQDAAVLLLGDWKGALDASGKRSKHPEKVTIKIVLNSRVRILICMSLWVLLLKGGDRPVRLLSALSTLKKVLDPQNYK
jgi:hypothetical protein